MSRHVGSTSRNRAAGALLAVGFLALLALAGGAPWLGERSTLVNNHYEVVTLVIDENRVLTVTSGEFDPYPSEWHFVFASDLQAGDTFRFDVDERVGLIPAVGPESSSWRMFFDEERGVVVQKPASGPSVWIPLDDGPFRLVSLTSRDKELVDDEWVELIGLAFGREAQNPPPPPNRPVGTGGSFPLLLAAVAAALVLLMAAVLLWRVRRKSTGSGLRSLADDGLLGEERPALFDSFDEFDQFIARLLAMEDPAAAIRLAFAYAEAGPGQLAARELEETPLEWLRRVRFLQPDLAPLVSPLLNSYLHVRFADWLATPAAQADAIDGLVVLVERARPALLVGMPDR